MDSHGGIAATFDQLLRSCSDCLAWFGRHGSAEVEPERIERAFRSAELEGQAKSVFPDSCHSEYGESVEAAFNELLHLRAKLVEGRSSRPTPDAIAVELRRPRAILVTDWRSSLFDGAATPQTDGFIDDDYMPGWDSWLALAGAEGAYGERCLLSWIPTWLGDRIDSALAVDPAKCMSWAEILADGTIKHRGWGEPWSDA